MSNIPSHSTLEESILKAFRQTIVNLIINNNRIAEKLQFNPSDLQVLHLVELAGCITPKELAERTNLTTGGMTVVLDRLEKENLIKREKHPSDRRSLLITLSSGERIEEIHGMYTEYGEKFNEILTHYTDTELLTILSFLDKINQSSV
jgi:DNA-binding MarR family transcriptional regulator